MAQRRMISLKIIDTDEFLDMPVSARELYFQLCMRADDDGFIGNHKRIMKMINSNDDDLKVLLIKKFIIPFESGVCVIKHWKIHNYIRSDRYTATHYSDEFSKLEIDLNGSYVKSDEKQNVIPNVIPPVDPGKDRLGKDRLGKRFKKPTPAQIQEYLDEINCTSFTGNDFYNKYESNGWLVGKNQTPMKNWKSAVQTWISNERRNKNKEIKPFNQRSAFLETITPEIKKEIESFNNKLGE